MLGKNLDSAENQVFFFLDVALAMFLASNYVVENIRPA